MEKMTEGKERRGNREGSLLLIYTYSIQFSVCHGQSSLFYLIDEKGGGGEIPEVSSP